MKFIPLLVTVSILLVFLYIKNADISPHTQAFYTALDNFTYIAEFKGQDKHFRYTTHTNPFSGDCEDFAFTLQSAIGGEVWAVEHRGDIKHAVLLSGNIVYDNFNQLPIPKSEYPTEFIAPLKFRGKIINNQ